MRSSRNTTGTRFSLTKQGESSKNGELRHEKWMGKPTVITMENLFILQTSVEENGMQKPKPKFTSYCFYCMKQGHQIYECRSRMKNVSTTPRFEGYCYNCQKYENKSYECRS